MRGHGRYRARAMTVTGHDESTLNRLPELPTPAAGRTGSGWLEALVCVAVAAL